MAEDEYIKGLIRRHFKILELLWEEYPIDADNDNLMVVAALLLIADGLDKLHDNI